MNLIQQAQDVLSKNWKDTFSVPTNGLYPFQWNWDSGFVAMGHAHYDVQKSMDELRALFTGQWENGMVPHILFHSENETTYFPNHDVWNSAVNPGASKKVKTSGITQPPVVGFVLEYLLNVHPSNKIVEDFVREMIPKVIHYHRFLYEERDPKNEGLFYIFHPWESGRDNSPIWDEILEKIPSEIIDIAPYERRDTSMADASERPTSFQYDRYVYLLELGRRCQYDGHKIAEESPFLVQDCMMNAILVASNESLIRLSEKFHLDTTELQSWQELSKAHFSKKFWNDNLKTFTSYDLRHEKNLTYKEIGGISPIFAKLANEEQFGHILEYLKSLHDRDYYLCPSFDPDSPLFDSKRYWRGPVWPQMNWLIHHGLRRYGEDDWANVVKQDLIDLVQQCEFYEYFESDKSQANSIGHGYGGAPFSWTASTIISFLS